jgi:hypothetical protein
VSSRLKYQQITGFDLAFLKHSNEAGSTLEGIKFAIIEFDQFLIGTISSNIATLSMNFDHCQIIITKLTRKPQLCMNQGMNQYKQLCYKFLKVSYKWQFNYKITYTTLITIYERKIMAQMSIFYKYSTALSRP